MKALTANEIATQMKAFQPIIWIQTDEENRLLTQLNGIFKNDASMYIWKSTTGKKTIQEYLQSFINPEDSDSAELRTVNDFLRWAHTDKDNDTQRRFYFLTDAEVHIEDKQAQRRLLDYAHLASANSSQKKVIVLLSYTVDIPAKLQPYIKVFKYALPDDLEIASSIYRMVGSNKAAPKLIQEPGALEYMRQAHDGVAMPEGTPVPEIVKAFGGMLSYQREFETLSSIYLHKKVDPEHIKEAKKQILAKTNLVSLVETDITFSDIGGLARLKEWLTEMKVGFTPEGRAAGLPPLRGVMLAGITGTGKSLTAKAVANEFGVPLVKFDLGKVFQSTVGSSEHNMDAALHVIEQCAPCVVWADEFEKMFAGTQSSGHTDSGVTARVHQKFLTWLEEHGKQIFFVATANAAWSLPPEMLNRFNEIFFVELPDAENRKAIIEITLDRYFKNRVNKIDIDLLASDAVSRDLVGRDIDKAISEATYRALAQKGAVSKVTTEILKDALSKKVPIVKTMEEMLMALTLWVGYDPQRKDGIRARYANGNFARHQEVLDTTEQIDQEHSVGTGGGNVLKFRTRDSKTPDKV